MLATLAEIRAEAERCIDMLTDYTVRDTDACSKTAIALLGDAKVFGLHEKIVDTDAALPELAAEAIAARGTEKPSDTPAILTLFEISEEVLKVGGTLQAPSPNRMRRQSMVAYLEGFIKDIDATTAACPEWDEWIRESDTERRGGVLGSRQRWSTPEPEGATPVQGLQDAVRRVNAVLGDDEESDQ